MKYLWEFWDDVFGELWYRCSNCGEIFLFEMKNDTRYKYCPNCGKEMRYADDIDER